MTDIGRPWRDGILDHATKQSFALVAELVDAPDLGSGAERREGSSPS